VTGWSTGNFLKPGYSWSWSRKSWTWSPIGVGGGHRWSHRKKVGGTTLPAERAPEATTHPSNCMHRICDAYAKHIHAPTRIYSLVSRNRLAVYGVYARYIHQIYYSAAITCPAPRRHTAKKTESDRESIATLAGPNIYTLIAAHLIEYNSNTLKDSISNL
jgi:hypothetical protein